jgi:hypothetical protein
VRVLADVITVKDERILERTYRIEGPQ